jgi:hypothetical protein
MKILSLVFSAIGVSFLCVGLWWSNNTHRFLATARTADGVVVDLAPRSSSGSGLTYAPVIEFQPPGAAPLRYTESFSSNPPSHQVGEHVRVYYDPAQPARGRLDGFFSLWFGPLLFSGMGLLFTLAGGGVFLAFRLRQRREAELRRSGRPLQVDFVRVEINYVVRINQRNPFRIVARGYDPVSLKDREFRSHNLMQDPTPYLSGGKLTVFLDPQRPGRYFLDTSVLPGGR